MRFLPTLAFCAMVAGLDACSASASDPLTPKIPKRSLGLALESGPCAEGDNVVSASAFVSGPGQEMRYLDHADGELQLALVFAGEPPRPVTVRWLDVPDAPKRSLTGPPWNLELTFNSPRAGQCPIRVDFRPTPEAATAGLGSAVTTIVLSEPPPPPPTGTR